jgi:hypothetical protein
MDLDQWLTALAAEIGTDDYVLDNNAIHTLLDLARDSAHEVERVAAPLTTFLVGLAVGRGQTLGSVAARATALAMSSGEAAASADQGPAPATG